MAVGLLVGGASLCVVLAAAALLFVPVGGDELCSAINRGDEAEVARLLALGHSANEGRCPMGTSPGGDLYCTPLQNALSHDQPGIAKRILRANADVNAVDDLGTTSLFYAITFLRDRQERRDMVALLLEMGAEVNHVDDTEALRYTPPSSVGTPSASSCCVNTEQMSICETILGCRPWIQLQTTIWKRFCAYCALPVVRLRHRRDPMSDGPW